jgi:hypothetical protein
MYIAVGQLPNEGSDIADNSLRHREGASNCLLIEIDLDEGPVVGRNKHGIPVVAGKPAQAGSQDKQAVIGCGLLLHPHGPPGVAGESIYPQGKRMSLGKDALAVRGGHDRDGIPFGEDH